MTCSDLCTAAKCEELERRISALEQALELLEASFEAHTQQDIPIAHQYNPYIRVDLRTSGNSLFCAVYIDDRFGNDTVELDTDVAFDIFGQDDGSYVFKLLVNGESDEDTLRLLPSDDTDSNLKLDGIFQNETLILTVADGTSFDTAEISIPLEPTDDKSDPESEIVSTSNLRGSASFRDGILTVTIADGNSQDTFQVSIPTNTSPQTIFVTEEVYMNCDELERKIDDCCQQIIQEINSNRDIVVAEIDDAENSLTNQIDSAQFAISSDIKTVEDYVTVDISGTIDSNYQCNFPTDDNENLLSTYAQAEVEPVNYSGTGLIGIHENLKYINANLRAMYDDICKAIDPISSIEFDDLYKYCQTDDLLDRSQYFDEQNNEKYVNAAEQYQQAIEDYLTSLVGETKYEYLLETRENNVLITAPNSYITRMLADFALIQSKINNTAICDIEIPPDPEVVSIVASDKVIPNASGKFLVLHFVTPSNYPKRARNSTYWQVQIPAALDNYVWKDDFIDLRIVRGNQYAELRFSEFKTAVSGFFQDKAAADDYFDRVLTLTTATEKNRVYPEHKTPQTNVTSRITRPYRAFIESINSSGQAVCHVKYVPTDENGNVL